MYDHTKYARWEPVYLADMKALPKTAPNFFNEFMMGKFVVKRSEHRFNEVPADQATEWISKICKTAEGLLVLQEMTKQEIGTGFCITWARPSQD